MTRVTELEAPGTSAPAENAQAAPRTHANPWPRVDLKDLKLPIAIAKYLVAKGVSPNAVSLAGMLFSIAAGVSLAFATSTVAAPLAWFAAATFIVARLFANKLDGMVAREAGRTSPIGLIYNEVPNRISDVFVLVGLGFAAGGAPTLGWLAALLAVFVAYVRLQVDETGAREESPGLLEKCHHLLIVVLCALWCSFNPPAPSDNGFLTAPTLALTAVALASVWTTFRRLSNALNLLRIGDTSA